MEQGDGYTDDVQEKARPPRVTVAIGDDGCLIERWEADVDEVAADIITRQHACIEDLIALLGWQREADAILTKHGLK